MTLILLNKCGYGLSITMRDLDSIYGEALEDFVRYKNIEYVKNIYEINKENAPSNIKKF